MNPTVTITREQTDRRKLKSCRQECEEYLDQISRTESSDLMEAASGALWDLVLEHRMQGRITSR